MRVELRRVIREIMGSSNITWNPGPSRLREEALSYARRTKPGPIAVVSKLARARDPRATRILQERPPSERIELVEKALGLLEAREYYAVERCIGAGEGSYKILGLVDKRYPHLALMLHLNFFPCERGGEPDIVTLDAPTSAGKLILVDRESMANMILGSDYYGELKMSFLRLAMNHSRDERLEPGLHAGSKLYRVRVGGELREVGVLVFGLSGTGKTTLTVESHSLEPPEGVVLRQDDIVFLTRGGGAAGTEYNLYPKTDSVPELPALQPAVLHQDAVLENVIVREDGIPDFSDLSITPNARALAIREAIPISDARVDLNRVDVMVFLTRRPEMPPLARLTSPEQAAAYFMLGESFRTSAEAGKPEPVRVPGFDPFMLEPRWRSALLIMDAVRRHNITVAVMNTGHVKQKKVPPELSKRLLLALVRGRVEWRSDPELGVEVAVRAEGAPLDGYDPRRLYAPSEYRERLRALREERRAHLERVVPEMRYLADYV